MKPELIAINNDDYHAKHIGKMANGDQFILTTPFVPAGRVPGCEFIALYLFDAKGTLKSHKIHSFGPRSSVDETIVASVRDAWLKDLGDIRYTRIQVSPFTVTLFDTVFGLIVREPDDDDEDVTAVEMQPGNYMAFFEPWDSGDYDT